MAGSNRTGVWGKAALAFFLIRKPSRRSISAISGGRPAQPPPGTITGRTINQILSTESLPGTNPNRMSAVGAYQVTIPTLREAVRALKLTGDEQLTPQMQDRIFSKFLIPKAGDGALGKLLNRGEGTVDQAQYAAAREWASFAVPAGYPTRDGRISDGTMSRYASPANRANLGATQALREFLTGLAR